MTNLFAWNDTIAQLYGLDAERPLRVLALWQPWATLYVARDPVKLNRAAPKEWETRHFKPQALQQVDAFASTVRQLEYPITAVVHATQRWNGKMAAQIRSWPFADCLQRTGYSIEDPNPKKFTEPLDLSGRKRLPLGALIGVVTITGVRTTESLLAEWSKFEDGAAESYAEEVKLGNYGAGRFGWHGENPIEFPEPIPYKGRQDVLYPLEEGYVHQVRAALAVLRGMQA